MAEEEKLAPNVSDNEGENGVSMVDILQEEEQLEADADAVLGDSDDKHCTYPLGYIGRQALYACATCSTPDRDPAGFCLACSYACHADHDLFELYTKRNFRCDCGNKKFPDFQCKLYPDKEDFNSKNRYNHNFQGLYCTCSRPYPDPDDEIEDEMIQCVICEDWYHGRHLGMKVPRSDGYQEMTCSGCMHKHEFLWAYNVHSQTAEVVKVVKEETSNESIDVCSPEVQAVLAESTTKPCPVDAETVKEEQPASGSGTNESKNVETPTLTKEKCLLKELQTREITVKDCGALWQEGWRSKLCTCPQCMEMYKDQDVLFLTDETDTVVSYEERGQAAKTPSTKQDRENRALQGMSRVQQIEMISGYNDMKSQLSEYLKRFAENGKVVREEDIREFFSQLESRKRQRVEGMPQFSCR